MTTLEEENRILQQLAEYRSAMISRVAHELRTPLTSILGFAEILLSQEELSPQQRNFCQRIQNSGQQLQNSLNQLSEIAHLDNAKSEFHFEEFALEDLLVEVANRTTTHTRKQGIRVEVKAPPDPPLIICDRRKLAEALGMIFDFTFARTEGGTINLALSETEAGCLVSINAQAGSQPPSRQDPSNSSDLALAVGRYELNRLGATLMLRNLDFETFEVLIELPSAPPNITF